jgi:hypothetical protein
MNVIEILKSNIIQNDEIQISKLPNIVNNWPSASDEDGEVEPADLENWEILEITENSVKVACGGDWQEPITFTLVADGDRLVAKDAHEGFEIGLGYKEILKILK